jgi:quercetin dioxygenase-like cupin family protein
MKKLSWNNVKQEALTPQLTRRFISGPGTTLARFELKKGCVVPTHHHENAQMSWVVEGCLRYTRPGGEPIDVRAGEVLVIPPNVPHGAEAMEDTVVTDVFSPERSDWAGGDDGYLRGKK